MKAVGIKALKNNLSRYLNEVRAGETVWVTDRDLVVAEIHSPTLPISGRVSRWEAWLNTQARAGRVRRAGLDAAPAWSAGLPDPPRHPVNLRALLEEARQDRS